MCGIVGYIGTEEAAPILLEGLRRLEGRNYRFDIIFMDPPYGQRLERQVLAYLAGSPMATPDTLVIVEAAKEEDFGWLAGSGWLLIKTKEYKTNKHVFVGREQE